MHCCSAHSSPPRNLLLESSKGLDKFFEDLNNQTTSGILVGAGYRYGGPMFDPIAWRETRKRSLGTVRYLFRLLIAWKLAIGNRDFLDRDRPSVEFN